MGKAQEPGKSIRSKDTSKCKVYHQQRYFGPWATIGFSSILGAAWQYTLIGMIWSLPNGSLAGTIYMYLTCCMGLMLTTLSLAEMASM
jgi:choline transport protein